MISTMIRNKQHIGIAITCARNEEEGPSWVGGSAGANTGGEGLSGKGSYFGGSACFGGSTGFVGSTGGGVITGGTITGGTITGGTTTGGTTTGGVGGGTGSFGFVLFGLGGIFVAFGFAAIVLLIFFSKSVRFLSTSGAVLAGGGSVALSEKNPELRLLKEDLCFLRIPSDILSGVQVI